MYGESRQRAPSPAQACTAAAMRRGGLADGRRSPTSPDVAVVQGSSDQRSGGASGAEVAAGSPEGQAPHKLI